MLAELVLKRDVRAAARLMRMADDRSPAAVPELITLWRHGGKARIVGVTGNPGSGKSSLVDCMIGHFRAAGQTVAVVAVDPSSPFSGGAILGDRVRMQRHSPDAGVFIRSLATRGAMGGLSASVADTVTILDAMGFDWIFVETVGVGQDEVDVVRQAHCTVVVLVPGLGDEIQAMKAGILEIADLFVVNKADRPGAEGLAAELGEAQRLSPGRPEVPVLMTTAVDGGGVGALAERLLGYFADAAGNGELRRRELRRIAELARRLMAERLIEASGVVSLEAQAGSELAGRLLARQEDPYSLAGRLLAEGKGRC